MLAIIFNRQFDGRWGYRKCECPQRHKDATVQAMIHRTYKKASNYNNIPPTSNTSQKAFINNAYPNCTFDKSSQINSPKSTLTLANNLLPFLQFFSHLKLTPLTSRYFWTVLPRAGVKHPTGERWIIWCICHRYCQQGIMPRFSTIIRWKILSV